MPAQWPLSLQQNLNSSSFSIKQEPITIRSTMSEGAPKVRRRFTQPITTVQAQIWVDALQYQVLQDFYNITLQGGTLDFFFLHPIDNTQHTYRFVDEIAYGYVGHDTYNASWEMEELP